MTGHNMESIERQAALRRKVDSANGPDTRTPEHPLLTLQSQIGNAQVARLLAQRESPEEDELQAKHDVSLQREAEEDELQAQHDVSLQREAEEDELQAQHDVSLQREAEEDELQAQHDVSLQREAEEDELQAQHDVSLQREAAEEDELQAKHEAVGIEGGPVGPDTEQRIQSARGGGSALDTTVRSDMESGFGTSFDDVRVHQDSESDVLTRRLTSHAFTTGSDIFLRSDASAADNHLIAHELTHVVQQRSMAGGSGMSVGAAGDPHEHQADATADAVLSGATVEPTAAQREAADEEELQADHDVSLQREPAEDQSA